MSKLTSIFSQVLGIEEERVVPSLSPENESSWDSLNAIILLTEIERAFAVKFDFEEAMSITNFGELLSLLQSKGIDPTI